MSQEGIGWRPRGKARMFGGDHCPRPHSNSRPEREKVANLESPPGMQKAPVPIPFSCRRTPVPHLIPQHPHLISGASDPRPGPSSGPSPLLFLCLTQHSLECLRGSPSRGKPSLHHLLEHPEGDDGAVCPLHCGTHSPKRGHLCPTHLLRGPGLPCSWNLSPTARGAEERGHAPYPLGSRQGLLPAAQSGPSCRMLTW